MTLRNTVRRALALPATFALAGALTTVACSNKGGTSASHAEAKKTGPVVAHVGSDVITADEVKQKLAEQSPFLQARYRDLAHKKEFVQNLVRFEVLAQEAYKKGLDKQPEVQATIKKVLVQELIRQAFDEKQATFSDQELKDYYDKHIDEFVKPERVRAQHVFLSAPETDKAARAKAKAKAAEILAQLKANEAKAAPTSPQHAGYNTVLFADLARQYTADQATQATGGDMRYLSQDDMGKQYSAEFAKAVFALKDPNELTGIVETPQGFHIARLTNRQLAVNRSFDDAQVKDTIKGRLFREQRTKTFDDYVEKLKKDANVSIDDKVLEGIEVPNANPAAPIPGLPMAPAPAPVAAKPAQ